MALSIDEFHDWMQSLATVYGKGEFNAFQVSFLYKRMSELGSGSLEKIKEKLLIEHNHRPAVGAIDEIARPYVNAAHHAIIERAVEEAIESGGGCDHCGCSGKFEAVDRKNPKARTTMFRCPFCKFAHLRGETGIREWSDALSDRFIRASLIDLSKAGPEIGVKGENIEAVLLELGKGMEF